MYNKNDLRSRPTDASPSASAEDVVIFPTTTGQRRFWLLDRLMPGGHPALNVPLAARLTGPVDLARLESALNEVIVRHEILRTSLKTLEGEIVQVIHPRKTLKLRQSDCSHWPASEQESRLHEAMVHEGSIRFDLTQAPLLRALLLTMGERDHVLLLTTHHVTCDGWSQGILLHEVATTYASLATGSARPELPLQYADFAQWQEDWLQTEEAKDQGVYWKEKLKGPLPLVNLPTDRPRRPGRTFPGGLCSALVEKNLAERIKAFCLKENLTPAMVYLTAYGLLLRGYSGNDLILTGSTAANRGQTELEDLIGFFANPILVRLDFSGNPTLKQLLRRVREISLEAFANQSYPFEKVAGDIPPAAHQEWMQWLQVYFVYQKTFLHAQDMAGVQLAPMHSVSCGALFEWTLVVIESEEGIRLQLEYDAGLFDSSSIEAAFADYQKILTAFPTGSNRRLEEIEVLGSLKKAIHPDANRQAPASIHHPEKPSGEHAPSLRVEPSPFRTPTQRMLGELWKELLGVDTITTADSFFELGGKSLATLRLLAQIEEKTGRKVSPAQLLERPSIESLAAWLDREAIRNLPRSLVPLNAEGSLPPLFFIMESGRDVSELKSLASRLGSAQPSYGVPLKATAADLSVRAKAEELAGESLKEIQAYQPKGPYFLSGDSFAAGVAYEIARLLVSAGESVGMLALIDTHAPSYAPASENAPQARPHAPATAKPTAPPAKAKGLYSKIVGLWQKSPESSEEETRSENGVEGAAENPISDSTNGLKPYSGKVLLLRALDQPLGKQRDRTNGWAQGARGGVEIIDIPGSPGSLMKDPALRVVAEQLLAKLRGAQTPGGSGLHPGHQASS